MKIQNQEQDTGVSPVVGVILMVAVTVILAAVIGNFVLNLGSSVNEKASASVQFQQEYNVSSGAYDVEVFVTQISSADYLNVSAPAGGSAPTQIFQSDSAFRVDKVNDTSGNVRSDAEIPEGAQAYASGDVVEVTGVESGDTIQVIGSLNGQNTVVSRYTVDNTQR